MNSSEIIEAKSKQNLLCRDGTLKIEEQMCIGDNLTQKLLISSQ